MSSIENFFYCFLQHSFFLNIANVLIRSAHYAFLSTHGHNRKPIGESRLRMPMHDLWRTWSSRSWQLASRSNSFVQRVWHMPRRRQKWFALRQYELLLLPATASIKKSHAQSVWQFAVIIAAAQIMWIQPCIYATVLFFDSTWMRTSPAKDECIVSQLIRENHRCCDCCMISPISLFRGSSVKSRSRSPPPCRWRSMDLVRHAAVVPVAPVDNSPRLSGY
jgi:hypothetical protein